MACVASLLGLVAPTAYSQDQSDISIDCRQRGLQPRVSVLLENTFEKEITQQQFYVELLRLDAKLKRAWATVDMDDAAREQRIARESTLELVACLTRSLEPSDKVSYFDECRRPIESITPGSCERGWIVRRDGKPIFIFTSYRIYYD